MQRFVRLMSGGQKLIAPILISTLLLTACEPRRTVAVHCPKFPPMPHSTAQIIKKYGQNDPATVQWITELYKHAQKIGACQ